MAVSYQFRKDPSRRHSPQLQVFNVRMAKSDLVGAAEICNELARMYLELGDSDHAYKWYKMGNETRRTANRSPDADKACGVPLGKRAGSRSGPPRPGRRSPATRRSSGVGQGEQPGQARLYPHLTGYVAFYTGDYKTAIVVAQACTIRESCVVGRGL